jgi:hypothetical protein
LDKRLGEPQSLSGRCGVETNFLSTPGMKEVHKLYELPAHLVFSLKKIYLITVIITFGTWVFSAVINSLISRNIKLSKNRKTLPNIFFLILQNILFHKVIDNMRHTFHVKYFSLLRSRGSSVSAVTRLGIEAEFTFPTGAGVFPFATAFGPDSGAHPV